MRFLDATIGAVAATSAALLASLPRASAGPPEIDRALRALGSGGSTPRYRYALVDLDDDGIPDAVVLLADSCGSGGCNLAILRGTGGGYRVVSSSTIAREPIGVLSERRFGWHTLSVTVGGGGAKPGPVLMRFDGTRYPLNPTMQPYAGPRDLTSVRVLELKE
jgi:hypothetical protein